MALTDETHVYEILLRFAADGDEEPTGTLKGAHIQRRRTIKDGDLILLDQAMSPQPIRLDSGDEGEAEVLSAVMGDIATQVIAENNALREEASTFAEEREALQGQVSDLTQLLTQAQQALQIALGAIQGGESAPTSE